MVNVQGMAKLLNSSANQNPEPVHISILIILDNISASKPTNSPDSYFNNFTA